MTVMVPEIPGADAVVAWFGHWPSFHDAEVLSVVINRGGVSMIRFHTWNVSAKVDRTGHFAREREAIVAFEFVGIKTLRLHGEDAGTENVIQRLGIEQRIGIEPTEEGYRLELAPFYGLAGELTRAMDVRHRHFG
jgi:hypothetical protein